MPKGLERRYGSGHLHFITFTCYRRRQLLRSSRARGVFTQILDEVRARFKFQLVGYVVMPEHVHLLISEPAGATPSIVIQVLKQRVSQRLRGTKRRRKNEAQRTLWRESETSGLRSFWQRRFYDFNVWSRKKRTEKLHYMHMNPVKRGLVGHPGLWPWSSFRTYPYGEIGLRAIERGLD